MYLSRDMGDFQQQLQQKFTCFLDEEKAKLDLDNCLRLDMHCHDLNSDVPDELWGRILGLPETWLKTKDLLKCLKGNNADVVTITNHNNARSCWQLLEKGQDVLVGAEFTCFFPEYDLFVHVLTYGFTSAQEVVLNKKRSNIYDFLRYVAKYDIPVVLPHPLYLYARNDKIHMELFEKLAVLFQRFEVLNGQRDQWQSVMTLQWLQSLTPEKIQRFAEKHKLQPQEFGIDIHKPKVFTGGTDDHMGIFAGECGTYLYVPDLQARLQTTPASVLALEAIKAGRMTPFGYVAEHHKLNIALLDYFTQVALNINDPGLLRLALHRGEVTDKLACLAISNLLLEMKKRKNTQKFFQSIHGALRGKKVSKLLKWSANKDYRFCINYLDQIAEAKHQSPEVFLNAVNQAIPQLFHGLNTLMVKRIKHSKKKKEAITLDCFSTEEIAKRFEIPSQLTALFLDGGHGELSGVNVGKMVDNLSFPALVSLMLVGTTFASTRLLYSNRKFLNEFAAFTGNHQHPKRALYLTDTLRDKNGVSHSLSGKLIEIQRQNLPVDFLICHADVAPEPHLHVVKPITSFSMPAFGEQEFRVPDVMEIARIFYEGDYDRIVCSTEGPMAAVSILIKYMFNVPSYFFMHTDWIDFIKHTTDLSSHERDRIRRFLRFFYKQYHGVFVLNNEHKHWLTGHEMELDDDKVLLTAHHTQPRLKNIQAVSKTALFPDATEDTPVLMYAGRLSKEKGLFDLPDIIKSVREQLPNLKVVIAGSGPAGKELQELMPEALFTGWMDKAGLASLYAGLDLFVFPSQFDTFGNVVLEAFVNGMPVVAYDCKGPKDIIEHGRSGYLAKDKAGMSACILQYFTESSRDTMKKGAMKRSEAYQAEPIMRQFMQDMGLG
ncbi:MAG: glycosyl transferase family 1 [Zetaproteobacteria bacterium CG2_30_46_52]|nr:MAG: glycosyl transferase family 1 [Zetaproteobacteria bacterium CG2_30_46_52]